MEFLVRIKPSGELEGAPIDLTLKVLDAHANAFSFCLKRSAEKHDPVLAGAKPPRLLIRSAKPGSLDIGTIPDLVAGLAPMAIDIVRSAWNLYTEATTLISLATRFFEKEGKPADIQIKESSNAHVTVIQNSNIIVAPKDTYDAARQSYKPLGSIASLVEERKLDSLHVFHADPHTDLPDIHIDADNYRYYQVQSTTIPDPEPITCDCNIYRLNKRSAAGALELRDDEESRSISFTAAHEILDKCAEALNARHSTITATPEYQVNALGERRLLRLHIHQIANHFSDHGQKE